jgi:hypothetical protein
METILNRLTIIMFLIVDENDQPSETAVIVMKATQAKKSKKWNSMMLSQRRKGCEWFLPTTNMVSNIFDEDYARKEQFRFLVWMGSRASQRYT